MTHNSSPHWNRSRREDGRPEPTGQHGPSDPYTDLFAALDRADVSEAVRAAFAHALNPPLPPVGPPPDENDPRRRYTLHLTFPAGSLRAARSKAAAYAEALVVLRPELSTSPALLSRADQWNYLEPITCGRSGPGGETCARATEHHGCHRDSTTGGFCWENSEPTAEPTGDDDGQGDPTDHL